ncbi:MAG: hypothetical protein JST42_30825 [Bacteroidetes bacterium]|nr:hypothetical protein [Bacteroidota bacterium]
MTPYAQGYLLGQLFALLLFVLPIILFLLSQQRTLQVIRPEYRELRPGLVWLQLIPLFNLYWMFVVVTRIADSISKELVAREGDSILGITDYDAVQAVSHRPTYKIGMTYCFLYLACPVLIIFVNLFADPGGVLVDRVFPVILGIIWLALSTCWIVYWVKLVQNKRKLEQLQF